MEFHLGVLLPSVCYGMITTHTSPQDCSCLTFLHNRGSQRKDEHACDSNAFKDQRSSHKEGYRLPNHSIFGIKGKKRKMRKYVY